MSMFAEYQRDAARTLDRLVDGELSPRDRRELLALLDDEPGGWRRCALAFVEAQSWRSDLARVASEPLVRPVRARAAVEAQSRSERWSTRFALAACLLLAFVLGRHFSGAGPLFNAYLPTGTVTHEAKPAANPSQQNGGDANDAPVNWQIVTLVPLQGEAGEPIQLVVDSQATPTDQQTSPNAGFDNLAGSLAEPFERQGWDVQRVERFVPIELSDGRRLVVPIEELDIRSPDVVQF